MSELAANRIAVDSNASVCQKHCWLKTPHPNSSHFNTKCVGRNNVDGLLQAPDVPAERFSGEGMGADERIRFLKHFRTLRIFCKEMITLFHPKSLQRSIR